MCRQTRAATVSFCSNIFIDQDIGSVVPQSRRLILQGLQVKHRGKALINLQTKTNVVAYFISIINTNSDS